MGANCCHNKQADLVETAKRHKKVLWTVLWINLIMFGAEMTFGLISGSIALVADSLDMLGDTITYGSSIAAVGMATIHKAKVAKLKAWIMLFFAAFVFIRCIQRAIEPSVPDIFLMLSVGGIALAANLTCLYLLTSHREDDINMRSVWICSRNDIIANTSVLGAGVIVYFTSSGIPDLVVGTGLAILFTRSAIGILQDVSETLEKVAA